MEAGAAAATAGGEPAAKPAEAAVGAGASESSASSSAKDYNTTAGVSEAVQKQMDQGVDAAAASAMEYANYLSGQRSEGYGSTVLLPGACCSPWRSIWGASCQPPD